MKQYHQKRAVLFIVVVLAGLFALLVFAGEKKSGEKAAKQEVSVSLDKVPAPVRATIEEHAKGAEVKKIDLETENGKDVYEVDVVSGGKEQEFKVAADGKFLGAAKEEEEEEEREEAKETVAYEALPPAVKAAVEKHLGAQGPFEATKEAEKGTVVYEVTTGKQDKEMSIEVTEAGEVQELAKGIPAAEIPPALAAKIKAKYPNATIQKASHVQEFSYEVELLSDGKTQKMEMSPAGQCGSEEHKGEHSKGAQEKD